MVKHRAGFPSEWGFLTGKALNPEATGMQRSLSPGTRAVGRQPPHEEAHRLVLAPALVPWRGFHTIHGDGSVPRQVPSLIEPDIATHVPHAGLVGRTAADCMGSSPWPPVMVGRRWNRSQPGWYCALGKTGVAWEVRIPREISTGIEGHAFGGVVGRTFLLLRGPKDPGLSSS